MISALFYITSIVIALACIGAFYRYYQRWKRIRNTETTPIGDVRRGCCEIKGKIVALAPTLRSPLSGTPCVFYDVAIIHGMRNRWFSRGGPVIQDKSHEPFGIQDETGVAVIDLKNAKYALNLDHKRRITRAKPADKAFASLLKHYNLSDDVEKADQAGVICYETFLEEGDDLYVLGYVNRFDNDRPVFTSGEHSILISDKSEKKLLHHTLLYATLYLLLSLLVILLIFIYYFMDHYPG